MEFLSRKNIPNTACFAEFEVLTAGKIWFKIYLI